MEDGDYRSALPDPDEGETQEWRDSILSVEENFGPGRARQCCKKLSRPLAKLVCL